MSSLQPRHSQVSWVSRRTGNSANLSPESRNAFAFANKLKKILIRSEFLTDVEIPRELGWWFGFGVQ